MNDVSVRMDPLNPGHFFACCGLLHLMSMEDEHVTGWFQADESMPRAADFRIKGSTPDQLTDLLAELKRADVSFIDLKGENAVRPAVMRLFSCNLELDWWLNEFRDDTENLKCWAGQVTTQNLFCELLPLIDENSTGERLFEAGCLTKAKFGVDPRSAWNALDFGFSPNEHGRDAATSPAVEILAAIGLQGFRPDATSRKNVGYALWHCPLPASVARLAFRRPWDGLPHSSFTFDIAKRGQSYKYFTFAVPADKENSYK